MIYQQVPMIRLARGGRKLEKDGEWHPFGDDGNTYYRVVKKVMQRVRLEAGENPGLYHLFDGIDPLPSRASKEGFREEIQITIEDDHYVLGNIWLRAYVGWEMLSEAVSRYGGRLEFLGANSLQYSYVMEEFTRDIFRKGLLLSKALTIVGSQLAEDARLGIPHIQSEVKGLLHSSYTILLEEIGDEKQRDRRGKKGANGDSNQETLF